jgi:DNA polymerase-3 subunit gamma/tau
MSLYHRYRPTTFDEIVGARMQEVVSELRPLLASDDPPHAYLLHGSSGCGKTTLGRILCRELGVVGDDYEEKDSGDYRGIDAIRDIRRLCYHRPMHGKRRAYLLDEVHSLTREAQDALLKGLEDPPPHAYFVLCTTNPDKLLATIRGRCVQFQVHPLEEREMIRHLNTVAREEGESIPRDVLRAIADKSDGHSRDALQILEKVLAAPPERRVALVDDVATVKSATQRLARTLLEGTGWRRVADELTRIATQEWRDDDDVKEKAKGKPRPVDDYDLEQIRRGVLAYCAKVLLGGENDAAADIINEFRQPFFESGMAGLVLACYGVVKA